MNTKQDNTTVSVREKAIEWWGNLSNDKKEELRSSNFLFHPAKHFSDLSEFDIEILWKVETEYKEQPTTLSVEEVLRNQFENVGFDGSEHPLHLYIKGGEFGANWQKEQDKELAKNVALHFVQPIEILKEKIEQDKELIGELLDKLNMFYATMTAKDYTEKAFSDVETVITKAKQYLNK